MRSFAMTRRDTDLHSSLRDAYDYMHVGSRDASFSASRAFGSNARELGGLAGGAAIAALSASMLGINIGSTPIPTAFLPAAIGYAVSGFGLAGDMNEDVKNAAHGATIFGIGLWLMTQTLKMRAQGGSLPPSAVKGAPPQIGACVGPGCDCPRAAQLTEAELIALAAR